MWDDMTLEVSKEEILVLANCHQKAHDDYVEIFKGLDELDETEEDRELTRQMYGHMVRRGKRAEELRGYLKELEVKTPRLA